MALCLMPIVIEPPVSHVQNNDQDDGRPVEGMGIMGESVLAKN
jgi:hypothetical protein